MDLLAIALWAGAGGGAICVGVALGRPSKRRTALILAAALFLPIGVFGILSIGVIFLVAAVVCFVGAILVRPPAARPTPLGR